MSLDPPDPRPEIRRLRESDAAGLIECVRRCYGETYGEAGFYDEDWLIGRMQSQRLISIGAVTDGRVIGHIGTTVARPGDAIGDTVAAIVEPAHRGQGLVHRMGRQLFAEFQQRGIVATRHLATGTHLRTQRPLAESGAIPTGVLLGHVRAGTQFYGVTHRFGQHRIGVVAYFQRYADLEPLEVHLPAPYASALWTMYARAGLERRSRAHIALATTHSAKPATQITAEHNSQAGILSVRVAANPDTQIPIAEIATVLEAQTEVTYVDVPLTQPDCPAAVEWLRANGFIFGALLPGTRDTEHIRMQHLRADQVNPDAIQCATTDGTALRDWIADELARERSPTRIRPLVALNRS